MKSTGNCPSCGTELAHAGEGEVCPACLFRTALLTDPVMEDAPREAPGTMIGRYMLLQEIGEGGFGIVYLARQTEPVERTVALKVLKPGMDTREVVARFEAERQALAMMDHPNIAQVHDGGATDHGRPYFVMELVKGMPLTTYCDNKQLGTRQRVGLFLDVLSAVQHAHQKGIIHRDLKPSNILVSENDGPPVIKVIDFGIAKAVNMELTSRTLFTGTGRMVGTPEYASPEQAEQSTMDVDTRSDIYSLGVVLYELLTGTTPLDPARLRSAGYAEIQRLIREDEPRKPSTCISMTGGKLTGIAHQRDSEPVKLARQVRGDLDWIVMKALEKDRRRRYETANGFAADLRRHLMDEPVAACPPSAVYRMGKLLRRHRGKAAALAAVAVSTMIGLGGIIWNWRAAEHARDKSERDSLTAVREWRRAEENAYVAHMLVAREQYEDRRLGGFRELLDRHLPEPGKPDLRGWEWHYLNSLLNREARRIGNGESPLRSIAWHPGGKLIAAAAEDGSVGIWNPHTGGLMRKWTAHTGPVYQVGWNPDGSRLSTAGKDGVVRLWNGDSFGLALEYRGAVGPVRAMAWSRDGRTIASGGDDSTLRLWNAEDGNTLHAITLDEAISALVFHPLDPIIACAAGKLKLLSTAEGKLDPVFTSKLVGFVNGLAWSPDGATLAGSVNGGQGYILTMTGEDHRITYNSHHHGSPTGVAWSPDGLSLASSGNDQTAQCWSVDNKCASLLAGHRGFVKALQWRPDGKLLATAGADGFIKLWKPQGDRFPSVSRAFRGWTTGISWSPDSARIAVASDDNKAGIEIVDPLGLRTSRRLATSEGFLWDVGWSPDGKRVAAVGGMGVVHVWDASSGEQLGSVQLGWVGFCLRWSPDSRHLLVVRLPDWGVQNEHCSVTVVDATGSRAESHFYVPSVHRACWSPDGMEIITCGGDGKIARWDWKAGLLKRVMHEARAPLFDIKASPDGGKLAASGENGRQIVLDASGRLLGDAVSQTSDVESLSWSPDSSRIASIATDGSLKIQTVELGEEVFQVPAHGVYGYCVAWSPDGRRIATGGYDRRLRVWDRSPDQGESGNEMIVDSTGGPPADLIDRPRGATAAQIDLSRFYNGSFKLGWLPSNQWSRQDEKILSKMEPGLVKLGEVDFDVRGVIQTSGVELKNSPEFPERVEGIGIGARIQRLHFLHACAWDSKSGTKIGNYVIHYADGSTLDVPLVCGVNIRDWNSSPFPGGEPAMKDAREVWRDTNAYVGTYGGGHVRLYTFVWENPKPDMEIRSIDLISGMTRSAPFLMAITSE